MRNIAVLAGVCLLAACAGRIANTQSSAPTNPPTLRAVNSGTKQKIDFFDSINPACEVSAFPEVTVARAPTHGTVTFGKGEDYPDYPVANVRHVCNDKLLGSIQVFYQSNQSFQGEDTFSIEIRFPAMGQLWARTYRIEVR